MRPLTSSRPKVMLPLVGKPILEHLIRNVREAGIKEIIIVVGYKEEAIREYFGDGRSFGVSITYVVQRRQLGTADALRTTEPFITDTFLMLNGDMVIEIGTVTVFCYNDLSQSAQILTIAIVVQFVVLWTVDEANHVGILLNST